MIHRLPSWFKQEIPQEATRRQLRLLSEYGITTVCQHARCPNLNHCFNSSRLTFMILGNRCTRHCRFCAVNKTGMVLCSKQECLKDRDSVSLFLKPSSDEGQRIGRLVKELDLEYVVITSVTRDDLPDAGAAQFAETIASVYGVQQEAKIEVLVPDFAGSAASIKTVVDAAPFVFAHNIETVPRLYPELRPEADYQRSLEVLAIAKRCRRTVRTKSSLMLGLGEYEDEVIDTLRDLKTVDCDIVTLGQYLAPSSAHYPVKEFISPEQFNWYRKIALAIGFKKVQSGPLVRSSYHAERLHEDVSYV